MAIVIRNGIPRYQRSARVGDRVTTEYVASGDAAFLIDEIENERRERDRRKREARRRSERDLEALDQAVASIAIEAKRAARIALEAAGFRQHRRGEWRRRRGI